MPLVDPVEIRGRRAEDRGHSFTMRARAAG
jgi:hypothetical protein